MSTKNSLFIAKGILYGLCLMLINCKNNQKSNESAGTKTTKIRKETVVNEPFKNVRIDFDNYSVDPGKDATILTKSGSKIHIKANSLLDINGNMISEPVVIKYREFNDPAEIMASGIPMSFKNNPGKIDEVFQSAGMFEIQSEAKSGKKVFINPESPLVVDLATNNTGDGFSNFYLDPRKGDWIYSGQESKKLNLEKLNLNKQIKKLKEETAFMGKNFFILNSMGLLDAYFDDDFSKISPYYEVKNKPLPKKLLKYGIKSKDLYSYSDVEIGRNEYPASMVVWEGLDKSDFPKWTKNMVAFAEKINGDIYEISVKSDDDKSKIFKKKARAIMSIKSMLRFSPEHWQGKYNETMEEIRKQEESLAKMKDVYRTLEVSSFGIYNCDRFYKNPESFSVNAKIKLPVSTNSFRPERVFYVSTKDKVSIDYKMKDIIKITMCSDSTASLYTVLENDMLAKVGPEILSKLSKEKNDNGEIEMEFKPVKKISSVEDIRKCIGL